MALEVEEGLMVNVQVVILHLWFSCLEGASKVVN